MDTGIEFFDSNILIATSVARHIHHAQSMSRLASIPKGLGACAAHSLAEVYAGVTRLPGGFRASREQAILFLSDMEEHLTIVSLDAAEYSAIIRQAAANGILGATIYDALLAACAIKAKAETIYTDNERHFRMFGPDVASRVRKP